MLYKFLPLLVLLAAVTQAQDKLYTKDMQNGYYWHSLNSPVPFSNPKHHFLSGLLERYNILKSATSRDYLSDCREELVKMQTEEQPEFREIDHIVKLINSFYSYENNLFIPIADAYCYCIKEAAGADNGDLESYLDEIIKRYSD